MLSPSSSRPLDTQISSTVSNFLSYHVLNDEQNTDLCRSELPPAVPAKDTEVNADEYSTFSNYDSLNCSTALTTAVDEASSVTGLSSLPTHSEREQRSSFDSANDSKILGTKAIAEHYPTTTGDFHDTLKGDSTGRDGSRPADTPLIRHNRENDCEAFSESQMNCIHSVSTNTSTEKSVEILQSSVLVPSAVSLASHDAASIPLVAQVSSVGNGNQNLEDLDVAGSYTYPFRFYQPGIHARAGPLPSPPENFYDSLKAPNSPKPMRPPRFFARMRTSYNRIL